MKIYIYIYDHLHLNIYNHGEKNNSQETHKENNENQVYVGDMIEDEESRDIQTRRNK